MKLIKNIVKDSIIIAAIAGTAVGIIQLVEHGHYTLAFVGFCLYLGTFVNVVL